MNVVVLSGRLTRDPELRYTTNSQTPVCTFTLAVDRPVSRDRQNNGPTADFIRVTVYGRQAENCSKYLQKGREAAVQGRIQTGSYQNRDGQTVYITDVIANRVEFIGGRGQGNNQNAEATPTPAPNNNPSAQPQQQSFGRADYYDDIPDGFEMIGEDKIPF